MRHTKPYKAKPLLLPRTLLLDGILLIILLLLIIYLFGRWGWRIIITPDPFYGRGWRICPYKAPFDPELRIAEWAFLLDPETYWIKLDPECCETALEPEPEAWITYLLPTEAQSGLWKSSRFTISGYWWLKVPTTLSHLSIIFMRRIWLSWSSMNLRKEFDCK